MSIRENKTFKEAMLRCWNFTCRITSYTWVQRKNSNHSDLCVFSYSKLVKSVRVLCNKVYKSGGNANCCLNCFLCWLESVSHIYFKSRSINFYKQKKQPVKYQNLKISSYSKMLLYGNLCGLLLESPEIKLFATAIADMWKLRSVTAQKMEFSIKDFFNKCDQTQRKLRIWSHLLKKSSMDDFIFCAACTWRITDT